jgi:hypothetical protein
MDRSSICRRAIWLMIACAAANVANADCQCACVNGTVQAICESAIDLKPLCPPTLCPLAPPAITPIAAPTLPPIGTSHCAPKQVVDPNTGEYIWRTLCE